MLGCLVRYYYDFRRHFAMNLVEEDHIRSLVSGCKLKIFERTVMVLLFNFTLSVFPTVSD